MQTFTASEARAALPAILDRVEAGEELTITRHGRPVAVVMRPDAVRARRMEAVLPTARWVRAALEEARSARELPRVGLSVERAEELVAHVRRGRSGR